MEAARHWARGELTSEEEDAQDVGELDAAAAAFGLVLEGPVLPTVPEFYLWPENAEAWYVFMSCGPAWRSNMAGREGLDDACVDTVIADVCRVRFRKRRQRKREVYIMAAAALHEWAKARAKEM